LIESITYRAEWCGIRAIERGEVESPKWNRGYYGTVDITLLLLARLVLKR
jgi:hypothetical protein